MQCLSNLTHELLLETRKPFIFNLPVGEVRMFNLPRVYIRIMRFFITRVVIYQFHKEHVKLLSFLATRVHP